MTKKTKYDFIKALGLMLQGKVVYFTTDLQGLNRYYYKIDKGQLFTNFSMRYPMWHLCDETFNELTEREEWHVYER